MGLFDMIRRAKLVFPRREEPQFDNSLPSDAKTALKWHADLFRDDARRAQTEATLKRLGARERSFGWEFLDGSRIESDPYMGSVTATGPRIAAAGAAPTRVEPTLD